MDINFFFTNFKAKFTTNRLLIYDEFLQFSG